jgi:hypothetical protein
VLVWAGANLAIGYLLSFPLLTAVLLGRFVQARAGGGTVAPFHGAEATAAVAVVVVVGVPLALAAVLVNRAVRRRPALRRWPVALFWPVTAALLLGPFAWCYLAEPTVPQMLGKGLLW